MKTGRLYFNAKFPKTRNLDNFLFSPVRIVVPTAFFLNNKMLGLTKGLLPAFPHLPLFLGPRNHYGITRIVNNQAKNKSRLPKRRLIRLFDLIANKISNYIAKAGLIYLL